MTDEEVKKVLSTISALYPTFNSKGDDELKLQIARVWKWKLIKADYRLTMAALNKYSNTEKFPPTAADILRFKPKAEKQTGHDDIIKKVNAEKNDPELSKIRNEKLVQLEKMLGGLDNG